MSELQVGIIVLAAGSSTKLGSPKQLVQYEGKSLIRRSVDLALAVESEHIIVVLGSNASAIADEITDLPVEIEVNHNWYVGISSSLRVGIAKLLELDAAIDAALIMLSDQPFITVKTINLLLDAYRSSGMPIAAAEYDGILGVPALFDRAIFEELMLLEGDAGARVIIRRDPNRVAAVSTPEAAFDIDTPDDRERLEQIEFDRQRKGTAK